MSVRYDRKQTEFRSIGIDPAILSAVPDGSDGQLAVVTDQGNNRLYVREDGYLVPVVDPSDDTLSRTLEDFEIFVNPATGTTPASGTIIHTQAEAITLGTVATVQDALDVLPTSIEHSIGIHLSDGYHYGKAANSGRSGVEAFVSIRAFKSTGQQYTPTSAPLIRIHGAATTVDEEQDGVLAAMTLTRDVGEWEIDEMKGRHAVIQSGTGVGYVIPIVSNTSTVLTIPPLSLAGACAFTIEEYMAYCVCSLDGAIATSNGILIHPDCETRVEFYQLSIGYDTIRMKDVSAGQNTWFVYCQIKSNTNWTSSGPSSNLTLYYSSINLSSSGLLASDYGGISCTATSITGSGSSYMISSTTNGIITMANCLSKQNSTYSQPVYRLQDSKVSWADCVLNANNSGGYGVWFTGDNVVLASDLEISNSNTAITAYGGKIIIPSPYFAGSGTNTIGYKIEQGAQVLCGDFTQAGSTSYPFVIDEVNYATNIVSALGDVFIGKYNSIAHHNV